MDKTKPLYACVLGRLEINYDTISTDREVVDGHTEFANKNCLGAPNWRTVRIGWWDPEETGDK